MSYFKYNKTQFFTLQDWRQSHQKRLVALWSVKRLRHRTYDNYQYEIQYTISPITPSIDEEYVTRNGGYDYAIPGHVFITKNDNPYKNHPTEVYTEVRNPIFVKCIFTLLQIPQKQVSYFFYIFILVTCGDTAANTDC